MIALVNFFIIFAFLLIIIISSVWGFYFTKKAKLAYSQLENSRIGQKFLDIETVTVLIPFRNEAKNLRNLFSCIEKQVANPSAYIFINDHSNDESVNLIHEFQATNGLIQLLELSVGVGKKQAIRVGVNHANSEFILTWDADISIPTNYFIALSQIGISDLTILPVKMIGKSILQNLFSLDYVASTSLNWLASLKRPIMASGANLLVNRQLFIECASENHRTSSGDDMFLLRDFRKMNKSCELVSSKNLTVTTFSPTSFVESVAQRVRWLKKTGEINDYFALIIGLILALFNVAFIVVFGCYLFSPGQLLILITLKITVDCCFLIPVLRFENRINLLWLIPFYAMIIPVYAIFVGVLAIFYAPKWKGRTISNK